MSNDCDCSWALTVTGFLGAQPACLVHRFGHQHWCFGRYRKRRCGCLKSALKSYPKSKMWFNVKNLKLKISQKQKSCCFVIFSGSVSAHGIHASSRGCKPSWLRSWVQGWPARQMKGKGRANIRKSFENWPSKTWNVDMKTGQRYLIQKCIPPFFWYTICLSFLHGLFSAFKKYQVQTSVIDPSRWMVKLPIALKKIYHHSGSKKCHHGPYLSMAAWHAKCLTPLDDSGESDHRSPNSPPILELASSTCEKQSRISKKKSQTMPSRLETSSQKICKHPTANMCIFASEMRSLESED